MPRNDRKAPTADSPQAPTRKHYTADEVIQLLQQNYADLKGRALTPEEEQHFKSYDVSDVLKDLNRGEDPAARLARERPVLGGKLGQLNEYDINKIETDIAQFNQENAIEDRQLQEDLRPFILEAMGIQQTTGPDGAITYAKVPKTENEILSEQVQTASNQATLDALTGKMPVSAQLEGEIAKGNQAFEEQMRSQGLLPGSSPYLQAQAERDSQQAMLRDNVRFGRMGQMDAMARARGADQFNAQGQGFQMMQNFSNAANPAQSNAMAVNALQGPAAFHRDNKMMQFQQNQQDYQKKVANRNALMQMGLGMGAGALTGGLGLLPGMAGGGWGAAAAGAGMGAMQPSLPGNLSMLELYRTK